MNNRTKAIFGCAISIVLIIGIVFGAIPLFHYWEQDKTDQNDYEEILDECTFPADIQSEVSYANKFITHWNLPPLSVNNKSGICRLQYRFVCNINSLDLPMH